MARPQRNNVDYFPFYCEEGKKMYYLEETYGNDGFAVFLKILRELARTDFHYLDLSKNTTLMFLSAKCKVSKETLNAIINDLVELEKFDPILWNENSIIWCQDFIDSIQDAYIKRTNECITYSGLLQLLTSLGIRKLPKSIPKQSKSNLKGDGNPQTILKDTKEEKTIQEENIIWTKSNDKFRDFLCNKFGVSEIQQPQNYFLITNAINKQKTDEKYDWFSGQCYFYFKYKEKAQEKTHGLKSFIGELDEIDKGNWNTENWDKKYQELKNQEAKESKSNVQPKGNHRIGSPVTIKQIKS